MRRVGLWGRLMGFLKIKKLNKNINFKISITNMKKIVTLLMLVTLTSVSAQQSVNTIDYKSNYNSDELLEIGKTILDPVEKYEFYKHLYIVYQIDDLKETVDDLKKDYEIEQENDELRNKLIDECFISTDDLFTLDIYSYYI